METARLKSEMDHAQEILNILRRKLPIREEDFASSLIAKESKDPFRVLVVTILSQNCTDIASIRAYRRLEDQVGVTIPKLSEAKARAIEKAIRVAGLYRQKARALKQIARIVTAKYSGNLALALRGPDEEVRNRLQELPKVGPKTADVLLSIWGRPTISVDTHVDRVSKRFGFASNKAKYDEVRAALMRLFKKEDYYYVPLYFMAHGRQTCKARRPICPTCPVEKLCPYPNKTR